jgi:hypothetical protein
MIGKVFSSLNSFCQSQKARVKICLNQLSDSVHLPTTHSPTFLSCFMTTRFLMALLLGLTLSLPAARAQIVRVTSGQNMQTLVDNATAGTVFIVEAGSYGDLTISKRIAIIGTGYYLGTGQQATTGSATFGNINFKAGAENAQLMSCAVNAGINIGASQVTVSRCLVGGNINLGFDGSNNVGSTGVTVKQCFVRGALGVQSGTNYGFSIRNNIVGDQIYLSINFSGEVQNNTITSTSSYGIFVDYVNPSSFVICKNNISTGFYNYFPQAMLVGNNVLYNNQTDLPASNKVNQTPASIFVGSSAASLDAQYMLSASSPAKGAGEGGTDAGAFGGTEPYVLGGLPTLPVVTELTVPQTAGQNGVLNVRIKARPGQ